MISGRLIIKSLAKKPNLVRFSSNVTSCRRFNGKVAIVTGSTQGIGYGIARRLAQEGAKVVVSSRKEANVEKAVKTLHDEGLHVVGVVCHVGKEDDRQLLISKALEFGGGVDVFVANAGMNPYIGPMADTPETIWDKVMNTNVKSAFQLTQQVIPLLKSRGGGSIVYVSSIVAYVPRVDIGVYSMSKTAILSMTKVFATELAPSNIRVNCLCPGMTDTKMFTQNFWAGHKPTHDLIMSKIPMKRLGKSEEMCGTVAYLCSDDASYVTGEVISVAGGYFTRI
ncbi:Dehydrogenase reductase SDR member 4 [Chamberlinius hualienensis]